MGEFLGWFIGWNLTLEYGFCAALIAEGWASYLVDLLKHIGLQVPDFIHNIGPLESFPILRVNLLAGLVILLLGVVVSRGARFGAIFTNGITVVNLSIIVFIIGAGSVYVKTENWTPFIPSAAGIFTGGGRMFFSFIGYDTVSTLAAEAINPARDIPIALMLTLAVATGLYMLVGLVITGMVPFNQLDSENPLTQAFVAVNAPKTYYVIAVAALLMMAATMFACLVGQPKIFQAIAKDGMLPKAFARENSSGTPIFSVTASTLLLALIATFVNGNSIGDMVTFGTLFGMSILCAGVLIVRFNGYEQGKFIGILSTSAFLLGSLLTSWLAHVYSSWAVITSACITMLAPFLVLTYFFIRYPNQLTSKSTAFSCPLMPLIPCLAIFSISYIMMSLTPLPTILGQFSMWTGLGLIIYFSYGIRYSHLAQIPTSQHSA